MQEAVLHDEFLLSIRTIYNLGPIKSIMDWLFWAAFLHLSVWNMRIGDEMWEQIARTSRDDLLKAVYIEEKRDTELTSPNKGETAIYSCW